MRTIFKYDALDSTNDLLLEMAENVVLESGTVVICDKQLKGRGQHGRVWHSDPDLNLTFSLLVKYQNLLIGDQFLLNKAIALSILEVLSQYSTGFKIKWPNDIYFKNKKIAGLLIENNLSSNALESSVIGIGLNVNQSSFPDFLPDASSLFIEIGVKFDRNEILEKICISIERKIKSLLSNKLKIESEYHANLYRLDLISVFAIDDSFFNGIIKGVDSYGRLKLVLEDDRVHLFSNGDIKLVSK